MLVAITTTRLLLGQGNEYALKQCLWILLEGSVLMSLVRGHCFGDIEP